MKPLETTNDKRQTQRKRTTQTHNTTKRTERNNNSPERKEDVAHAPNFLVFGHGPHYCVGKEYAINHLVTFLAIVSTSADWTRTRTENSDKILYLPTIYPADCLVRFKPWAPEGRAAAA